MGIFCDSKLAFGFRVHGATREVANLHKLSEFQQNSYITVPRSMTKLTLDNTANQDSQQCELTLDRSSDSKKPKQLKTIEYFPSRILR